MSFIFTLDKEATVCL